MAEFGVSPHDYIHHNHRQDDMAELMEDLMLNLQREYIYDEWLASEDSDDYYSDDQIGGFYID